MDSYTTVNPKVQNVCHRLATCVLLIIRESVIICEKVLKYYPYWKERYLLEINSVALSSDFYAVTIYWKTLT